jgi:hypothetical protein
MTLLAGSAVIHPAVDSNPPGTAEAFVFTAVTSGSAKVMQLYLDSGSIASRVILGIYSDSAGKPRTRLASVTLTAPKAGAWNTFTLPSPVSIVAGTKYWIALLTPTGQGTIKFRDVAGSPGVAYVSSSTTLTSLPATFSVGAAYQSSPVSAYVAVSVVTDVPPPPPPAAPVVTISCAPASVAEDGVSNLVYTFTRTGEISAPLTVTYAVSGSAANGTDYAAVGASVTFAAGSNTATVTVNPTADSVVESDETITIALTGSGYTIGIPGSATGTISNDDTAPPPPISGSGLFADGDAPNIFGTDSSNYELGTKFTVNQSGSIGALRYFRGAANADDTDAITLRLWRGDGTLLSSAVSTSQPGATGWQSAVLASPVAVNAGESYVVSYGYNFNDNSGAPENYAATQLYFTSARTNTSGTLSTPVAAGVFSTSPGSFPTQAWNNSNYWVDVIFSTSGAPILPLVSLAVAPATVTEDGTANLVYTFTRSGDLTNPLTVNYTVGGSATGGSDYGAIDSSVTFTADSAIATVTVDSTSDSTAEPNETVALALAAGIGYSIASTAAVIGTISNDDALPPGSTLRGWELNAANVGLAPFGMVGSQLPAYTGPSEIPAGSRISGVRFTGPISLYRGDIVIEKCAFRPTSVSTGLPIATTTNYNGNAETAMGRVVIRDCEFDGTLLGAQQAAFAFAFNGIADLQRNYIHHLGSGFGLANTGTQFDALIEQNFVTDTIAWGNAATTGNHIDAFTIRDFTDAARSSRAAIIRNNRFDAGTSSNVTGAFFIQAIYGRVDNVSIEGNLLQGKGYNLGLEQSSDGYSNITCINNRFSSSGWGTHYVSGGAGWATWQENYVYAPAQPDGKGAVVNP